VRLLSVSCSLARAAAIGSALACSALGLAAVVGSPTLAAASGTPVDVYYAASLEDIMNNQIGPAFDAASGDRFVGFPGPSKMLASEIKGKLVKADVFVSAAPAVNKTLEGAANGGWVSGYHAFGKTVLEIGYDPTSKFAPQLKTEPWYKVVVLPGFHLGRTDPTTDPKGALAVEALEQGATKYNEPALKALATDKSDVFPEADLVGRVQSGELDAGFFYAVEALAAHIPAVALTGFSLYATYTVAVLNHAPDAAAAKVFAAFLSSPKAVAILRADGMITH